MPGTEDRTVRELQVPVRKIGVEIVAVGGERWRGSLFLSDLPRHTGGPEDVMQLLNDERAFLPFMSEHPDSAWRALSKRHILRVHLEATAGTEIPDVARWVEDDVRGRTLVLDDGSRVTGDLCVATPSHAARLLDKLNLAGRFIQLRTPGGVEFIQRAHIVWVE